MSDQRPAGVRAVLAAAAAAALLLAGCATNPVTGKPDLVLMSEERELELGKQFHARMLEQRSVYDDPALQRYVEDLGDALAEQSHRPDIAYTFTVLDEPTVNAFALPGGYIYVTTGIMAYFNSEAELAGVLGHEIGHVTARHAVQRHAAATTTSLIGSILLAETGAGHAGQQLFEIAQLAAIRGYGRDQELQADRLGAQYLARAGYDSDEMLGVIKLLADQRAFERRQARAEGREPAGYHGLFATHPKNDARRKEVIRAAKQYEPENPRPAGRAAYLRRIEGLPFGPRKEGGVVADHAFLHASLDAILRAPEAWTITNRPDRLIFTAPEEAARLEARVRAVEGAPSPRDLLAERTGDADHGRALDVGRYPGYTVVQTTDTRAGKRRVRHFLVRKDDQAWYFIGLVRDADAFERFDDTFHDIVATLDTLDPGQRRRASPPRLRIVEVQPGQTYADLAADAPAGVEDPVARLRLLNGDFPGGEPDPGTLVKTLQ